MHIILHEEYEHTRNCSECWKKTRFRHFLQTSEAEKALLPLRQCVMKLTWFPFFKN